jgi:tetratricopeptide (TPR) repeat protein
MGNRLAQVRAERGWKKARLLHELRAAATRRGEQLPKDESLGRRVAVWENQDGVVGDFYRELLCEVYRCSAAELGLVEPPSAEPMAEDLVTEPFELPEFTRVDPGLVDLLRSQTQTLRLLDRRLGGTAVHGQAVAHVETVRNLVRDALPGTAREHAADELGQAAALAGWQALDMWRLPEAWRLHEVATAAARESGQAAGLSYARAQQAFILLDAGRTADALDLITSAQATARGPIPSELIAWLHAARGEALAALGERDAALRALDAATAALPAQPEHALPYLMLDAGHLARWRGHCLARLGEVSAIDDLCVALAAMPEGQYARAEVGLRVDLALAFRARGEAAESRAQAAQAGRLAGRTGSERQRRRIRELLGP